MQASVCTSTMHVCNIFSKWLSPSLSKRRIFEYKGTLFLVKTTLLYKKSCFFLPTFSICLANWQAKLPESPFIRVFLMLPVSWKENEKFAKHFPFTTIPISSCLPYQPPTFPTRRGKSVWLPQSHVPCLR